MSSRVMGAALVTAVEAGFRPISSSSRLDPCTPAWALGGALVVSLPLPPSLLWAAIPTSPVVHTGDITLFSLMSAFGRILGA